METLDHQTGTTGSRISSLEYIHAKYHCMNTALWLVNRSEGVDELLSSYHVGSAEVRASLIGASIAMPSAATDNEFQHILAQAQAQLETATKGEHLVTPIALRQLRRAACEPGTNPSTLGVLVLHHEKRIPPSELEDLANRISNVVEFTRLNRLATCITNAPEFLAQTSKAISTFLAEIGLFMLTQLNARKYLFINKNRSDSWLQIDGSSIEQLRIVPAARPFSISDVESGEPDRARHVTLRFPDDKSNEPAILVPIPQAGFEVTPVRFAKQNEFLKSLARRTADHITLLFYRKEVPGYLQARFSQADVAVAEAVFGFVAKYIESIIFESNANEVISHLDTDQMVQDDAGSILSIMSNISCKFKAITVLRAGRFERSIHFEKISETDTSLNLDEYLLKIKDAYFSRFYETKAGINNNRPFFGIDRIDGHTVFEIHFPRYSSESRIYLMRFDGDVISESALRSLVSLFSDLYSRVMREENIRERGNYLMQARHAVTHHLAAANRSLKGIRPLWERGHKDREYWLDLIDDPIIGSELARAVGSLGQANLIIENGRFAIGDLDSSELNRKPYRIADLIEATLNVLKYNRDDKHIGVFSKISGAPPKSMRGDGPLLSIALMNLLDNAIKYSPHYMKIRWRLEYLSDRYRLTISSVGDKLDANARAMLFQEGYRGYQSDRLNRRHGTGLGLPVAYRILVAHSEIAQLEFSAFEFDSQLGGSGNSFFFEMPYFASSNARAAAEPETLS